MTKSLDEILSEIEKRAESATERPWECVPDEYVGFLGQQFFMVTGGLKDEDGDNDRITSNRVKLENAEFIAHARTDIPKMAAVIRLLIEQRDEYIRANWEHSADDRNEKAEIGLRNAEIAKAWKGEE